MAVIGSIVYPPLMGFLSVGVGLGAGDERGRRCSRWSCGVVLFLVGRASASRRPRRAVRGGRLTRLAARAASRPRGPRDHAWAAATRS